METSKLYAKKAAAILVLTAVCMCFLITYLSDSNSPLPKMHISNKNDAAAFLAELGWDCDTNKIEEKQSVLPESFDELMEQYNSMQVQQGLDLRPYKGKPITVYQLTLLSYPGTTDNVYATLIVHKSKVIGGDIHAAAMDGFMHSLI